MGSETQDCRPLEDEDVLKRRLLRVEDLLHVQRQALSRPQGVQLREPALPQRIHLSPSLVGSQQRMRGQPLQ